MFKNTKAKKNAGFTLIELLVVIGIIALLSSIILSSLTQAKAQASNTKQIADYKTLLSALIQFKQDNGYYPTDGTAKTCIGNYTGGGCKEGTGIVIPNSSQMNIYLKKYISAYNFTDQTVTIATAFPATIADYKGFVFYCLDTVVTSQCQSTRLFFPALKNKNSCPKIMSDVNTVDSLNGVQDYTWCSVDLN